MQISRVGAFETFWGESLVWDEHRSRLYFVDCGANTLLWLDGDQTEPQSMTMPSLPTGVVPRDDGTLIVVLEDGLHQCDPDAGTVDLVSQFPPGIGGRCNDACADLDGNIITGKLNMGPQPGSTWQFSTVRTWTLLDPNISNTNGPAALNADGESLLIVGDTSGDYFVYDYDAASATVADRRVFGDTDAIEGGPDGTTVDTDNGVWCAIVGGSQLMRFTTNGLTTTVPLPIKNPTDVAFGGPNMDRLYVTTISGDHDLDGGLLVVDGLGCTGRAEPRTTVGLN